MVKCAQIFCDSMVLQREKPIVIWGTGNPKEVISGTLSGKALSEGKVKAQTEADAEGNWKLVFSAQKAALDVVLEITGESHSNNPIIFKNIGIGEVWLAGGQSNMEQPIFFDEGRENVLNGNINRNVRFFNYPQISFDGMEAHYDYSEFGFWREGTKEDLPYYTAVGYYFANDLIEALDVPIGIVGCNWGGTPACAWMAQEYLKGTEGEVWLEEYEKACENVDVEKDRKEFIANPMNDRSKPLKVEDGLWGKIMYPGLSREEQELLGKMMFSEDAPMVFPQLGPHHPYRPAGVYESMLKKVAPYSMRGVIWYQGESDSAHPKLYATVFGQMIKCWRDLWQEELPFLFVQLAPFEAWLDGKGTDYPIVREQQALVAKTVPNTWVISSSDAGMQWDIHPKNKKPIGQRLALLARKHIYGEPILADAPEFDYAQLKDNQLDIYFKYADGLHCTDSKIRELDLRDEQGNEIAVEDIQIVDGHLSVRANLPTKVQVSFAWTAFYDVNLYNKMMNPVKPFRVLVQRS